MTGLKSLLSGVIVCLVAVAGTAQISLVDDLREGGASSLASDINVSTAVVNDVLYFPATVDNGFRELYRSDGTAAGTYPVHSSSGAPVNTPNKMAALNDLIVFRAVLNGVGSTLWRSDGTDEGTYPILNVNIGDIICMTTVEDKVYFNSSSSAGTTLWVTDGTEEGTMALYDSDGDDLTFACGFAAHDGKAYFIGAQPETGQELWVTDGTSAGTHMVKDVVPGNGSGLSGWIDSHGGNIYFNATTADHGNELWISDGTEAGTRLLMDIWEGTVSSSPNPALNDDQFFFHADDGPNGREIWTTDGTEGGTQIWHQSRPGIGGNNALSVFDTMGTGYIGTFTSTEYGTELFTVTPDGEFTLVEEIVPGVAGIFARDWIRVGRKAFFVADVQAYGREVWETDGDAPGTFVNEIQEGAASSDAEILGVASNGFFFAARRPDVGKELFYYDASIASVIELGPNDHLDIYPNPVSSVLRVESSLNFATATITNQNGQMVGKLQAENITDGIDVSNLIDGMYILTLVTKEGDMISRQFVKVR